MGKSSSTEWSLQRHDTENLKQTFQSQFLHSCVCEQFIYFCDRSAYSAAGKHVDRSIGTVAEQFLSWEYLFRIFGIVSLKCVILQKKHIYSMKLRPAVHGMYFYLPEFPSKKEHLLYKSSGEFFAVFLVFNNYFERAIGRAQLCVKN
jgi:hypothetical protein